MSFSRSSDSSVTETLRGISSRALISRERGAVAGARLFRKDRARVVARRVGDRFDDICRCQVVADIDATCANALAFILGHLDWTVDVGVGEAPVGPSSAVRGSEKPCAWYMYRCKWSMYCLNVPDSGSAPERRVVVRSHSARTRHRALCDISNNRSIGW